MEHVKANKWGVYYRDIFHTLVNASACAWTARSTPYANYSSRIQNTVSLIPNTLILYVCSSQIPYFWWPFAPYTFFPTWCMRRPTGAWSGHKESVPVFLLCSAFHTHSGFPYRHHHLSGTAIWHPIQSALVSTSSCKFATCCKKMASLPLLDMPFLCMNISYFFMTVPRRY